MNIITAAQRHKQAHATLNEDYSHEHVGDYTEAALDYSDSLHTALWMFGLLLGFAAPTVALYNLVRPAGAGLGLVWIALALAAVAGGIHAYRRRINRTTIERINHVVTAAELARRWGRREH